VTSDTGGAVPSDEDDQELLAQRALFLRPDSMLAIVMLTDENDCSIMEHGQNYYVGQLRIGATPVRLPRARQECSDPAKGPNDPCCKSCGQNHETCPPDPTCFVNGNVALLTQPEDEINLRCFDQKRRFGIDFLYPIDRYVHALTSSQIPDRQGNLVPNPIFADIDPNDQGVTTRAPGSIMLAGVVGVPWQSIAREPTDLAQGFKSAAQLSELDPDLGGVTGWDYILGDPAADQKPADPYMVESIAPRPGVSDPNDINGHEWTIPNNDLQYACVFPLAQPMDCANGSHAYCECREPSNDNPLCAPNPGDSNQPTLQVKAKAYPSIRQLAVLEGMGDRAVVASACAKQVDEPAAADYGYRPAVEAVLARVRAIAPKD
jgi:hypothetical protein